MNINTSSSLSSSAMFNAVKRPDPTKIAEELYSKLDTKGQGYIEKSDLQSAFDKISSTSNSTDTNVDKVFSALDSDNNGKVTKTEFSASLEKIASELDGPAPRLRLQDAGNGVDQGFTKDQLTDLAKQSSSTDTNASTLFTQLADNFDTADANKDGRVDRNEAQTYQQANSTTDNSASSATGASQGGTPPPPPSGQAGGSSGSGSQNYDPADTNQDGVVTEAEAVAYQQSQAQQTTNQTTDDQVKKQIFQLIQAYGNLGENSSAAGLSITA